MTNPDQERSGAHTPAPWRTGPAHVIWHTYKDDEGRRVHVPVAECHAPGRMSPEEQAANATFIVTAVNSHHALKEALEHAVGLIESANLGAFQNGVTAPDGRDEGDFWCGQVLELARAALAATHPEGKG